MKHTVMSKMLRHKDYGWYGQLVVKTSVCVSTWNESGRFDTVEEAEEHLKNLGYVDEEEWERSLNKAKVEE